MAAAEPLQSIKEEVTCPICLELFQDPVTSECGHSFCQECITWHCQGDGDVACPLCNEKLRKGNLRPNRELKNIVELLKSQAVEDPRGGNMCKTHREPLRFYCKEDQTPVCLACERSQAHRGHTVVPVEEAVQEHRESIRQHLEGIESGYETLNQLVSMDRTYLPQSAREEEHQRLKRLTDKVATLLKVDTEGPGQRFADAASQTQPRDPDWRGVSPGREAAGETESQGPAGREPGSEPAAEKEEEKQEETRSHVGHICEEAPTPKYGLDQASLDPRPHTISSTTEDAEPKADGKSGSDSFQSRSPQSPVRPASLSGWRRQVGVSPGGRVARPRELQGCAVEVTLDPATAHPQLILSEDRKSVTRRSKRQQLPNNLERFNASVCVLGSEGFTSGRRYWEVEVGPRRGWAIGVARDSVQRKGGIQLKPDEGIWALDSSEKSQVPRKVGVYLDYEGGEVRFYNAETMARISSLTATFTGRLVPFFHLRAVGSRITLSPRQR